MCRRHTYRHEIYFGSERRSGEELTAQGAAPFPSRRRRYGGLSSVGRASDCGSECRGFEPHIPPEEERDSHRDCLFFVCILGIVIATPFPCGFPDLTLRISFKQTATNVFVNILNAYSAAILCNSQNYCTFACR